MLKVKEHAGAKILRAAEFLTFTVNGRANQCKRSASEVKGTHELICI
jgi:hypothetical protein